MFAPRHRFSSLTLLLVTLILVWPLLTRGADPKEEPVDFQKARQLYQRAQAGENLTADEKAYVQRAMAEQRRRQGDQNAQPQGNRPQANLPKPPPPADSLDLVPLTDLGADGKYKGFDGGLYGHGMNTPPAAHLKGAMSQAAKVVPLDRSGKPAADGKIVLLSIGMSNTTQEFSLFKQIADADPAKSANVIIVDGAQGGKVADAWAADKNNQIWKTVDQRIESSGVSAEQVQALWIKHACAGPARLGEFPQHAKDLQKYIATTLQFAKERFPNLRVAYLSSRIYAGYATTSLNPEPYAYEGAFANRWVIEQQIAGDPALNFDPSHGDVKAPVVLWGPYLWSNGVKGRKIDGLVYTREDLSPSDGTHPSNSGRKKVADLLLQFFKTDPTAKTWFVKGE